MSYIFARFSVFRGGSLYYHLLADLIQASAPVLIERPDGTIQNTPYQTGDGRHDIDELSLLVDGWLASEGDPDDRPLIVKEIGPVDYADLYEVTGIAVNGNRVTSGWTLEEPATEQADINRMVSHEPNTYILPDGYRLGEDQDGMPHLYHGDRSCEVVVHPCGRPQLLDGSNQAPVLRRA